MIYDMHVHTEFSGDCKESLENYFIKAKELGMKKVCFTDHLDLEVPTFDFQDRAYDYNAMAQKLLEFERKYDIKVIQGIEVGYRKSLTSRLTQIINSFPFGVVLLSAHHNDTHALSRLEASYDLDSASKIYLKDLMDLVSSDLDFDIVTHPDFHFRYISDNRLYRNYKDEYIAILKIIVEKNKVLEFNTATSLYFGDFDFYDFLLPLYKELGGINISLGSDSHDLSRYMDDFDKAKELLRKHGFNEITLIENRTIVKVKI